MKKTFIASAIMLVAISASVSANTVITYSDHDPVGNMRSTFVSDVWLPKIEEASNNKIRVRKFFGGALFSSSESLRGVGDGVADMGFVYPGHHPGALVAHSVFSLFPLGPDSYESQVWLYRQAYAEVPELVEELSDMGVKPLMITAGLPGAFAGVESINSLSDIVGQTWRAGDKWVLEYLSGLGAHPVSIPWADIYISLQTGGVDGVYTNYDGMHAMKFDEVAKNILISKSLWFSTPFIHVVNKEFYDNLSQENKEALAEASLEAEKSFQDVWSSTFDTIYNAQIAAGYNVKKLDEASLELWENDDSIENIRALWIEEARSYGLENAEEILDKVKKIHAEAIVR